MDLRFITVKVKNQVIYDRVQMVYKTFVRLSLYAEDIAGGSVRTFMGKVVVHFFAIWLLIVHRGQ